MRAKERIERLERAVLPPKNCVQVILCGQDGEPLPCRHGRPYVAVSKEQLQVQIVNDKPCSEAPSCTCEINESGS